VQALEQGEKQFALSASPECRPGIRRRLQADLERYLEHAARSADHARTRAAGDAARRPPLEPTYLELEFGFDSGERHRSSDEAAQNGAQLELPAFDLGGGVQLRGRVDRVDVGPNGDAVVYDYKGRSVSGAGKWLAEQELQVALYMRAVEQLLGLRVVGGFYQPLSGSDLRARGVLELGDESVLDCVGDDAREPEAVRVLLDQAMALARDAAAQAARGALEPRPRTCAFKGGCQYPAICRCESST
jgi:RecB family exonuclease